MKFECDKIEGVNTIKGYSPGKVKINDTIYETSLIISADNIIEWNVESVDSLTPEHLDPIIKLKPDLVLIGTGEKLIFPKPILLEPFHKAKIGIEFMNNAAACRTYDLTLVEGRRVVVALFLKP